MPDNQAPHASKDGSLRAGINKRSALVTVFCIVVFAAAIYNFFPSVKAPEMGPDVDYYFDLNARKIFIAPATNIAPFPAPSSTSAPDSKAFAAHAIIFSCGPCNPKNRYLAFLEMYTPQARQEILNFQHNAATMDRNERVNFSLTNGQLVRAPDGGEWYPVDSAEAQAIVAIAQSQCRGIPAPCTPSDLTDSTAVSPMPRGTDPSAIPATSPSAPEPETQPVSN